MALPAIAAVDVGISQAQNVSASVSDFVATQMPQLEGELNPINGTTARQLLDPLEQLLVSILSARDRVMRAHADVEEGENQYGGYLTQKTWAVTILFLLPLLFQVRPSVGGFGCTGDWRRRQAQASHHTTAQRPNTAPPRPTQIIFTLMNRSYAKCSGHLVVNMCCSCLCLVLFTLCALVFSTLAVVSSTACEYHLQAIDKIPPRNITIEDNVQLEITPVVIKSVLTCPAGPVATPTNNFVSLLGADQLFNVTDEAEEAISQIGEARASFDSSEAQIQLALIEVEQLGNGAAAFNASEALESLPGTRQEIADLLARLPSDPMDRQNATQRDRWGEGPLCVYLHVHACTCACVPFPFLPLICSYTQTIAHKQNPLAASCTTTWPRRPTRPSPGRPTRPASAKSTPSSTPPTPPRPYPWASRPTTISAPCTTSRRQPCRSTWRRGRPCSGRWGTT